MIFYFSGILPLSRKPGPDDPDILFMQKSDNGNYDRLVCLIYGKEADMIIDNVKKVEEKHHGKSNQKRTRRRS